MSISSAVSAVNEMSAASASKDSGERSSAVALSVASSGISEAVSSFDAGETSARRI